MVRKNSRDRKWVFFWLAKKDAHHVQDDQQGEIHQEQLKFLIADSWKSWFHGHGLFVKTVTLRDQLT